ncbi:MAG: insulinase family protein [Lachnospiraceae bacterium]|nr:insulinase family protein [Lachnospiraceae bacterium]
MNLEKLLMYDLIQKEELPEINSVGYYLKHKKSGAKLAVLENDDRNKVFSISFRTPPKDDTGVAHIMEHSVLNGSERYPVKDPFTKLAASSLNTFLNAMTYSDKTMYPIASCNDKDFKNLMGVYTDAVFCPRVIKDDKAFRQEGWSYHLDSEDGELSYNGVVYNEMKGAYSSVDSIMFREMQAAIFPDTCYALSSGGKPEAIVDLTYEDFMAFHKEFYHPSNSYIYLYGNADMEERLLWLDKEYLCKYDAISVERTMPEWQEAFAEPREKRCTYSVMENEPLEDKTNLCYIVSVDEMADITMNTAFQVLNNALCAQGGVVEKALYDAGIGKLVGGYSESMLQGYYAIIAKNTDEDKKDDFKHIIIDTLKTAVKEGLDKKALEAGIRSMEFSYREQDYGRWPAGLMIGIDMMQSWLYDNTKVFDYYKRNEVFKFLKEQIETDYYEKLIEKYILNNPHTAVLVTAPERGLVQKLEKATMDKLKSYEETLTLDDKKDIVTKTAELKAYQEEEDSPEALATLPRLTRDDIDKNAPKLYLEETTLSDGTPVLFHDVASNGIGYLKLFFSCDNVPDRYIKYLSMLGFMRSLDTVNYSYKDFANEIAINCGGINTRFAKYANATDNTKCRTGIVVSAKALYDKLPFCIDMIEEMIFNTLWTNEKRLLEVLGENRTAEEGFLNNSPHSAASLRGFAGVTPEMAYREKSEGITYYRFVKALTEDFATYREQYFADMKEVLKLVFRPENLLVSFGGSREALKAIEEKLLAFKAKLHTEPVEKGSIDFERTYVREGIKLASQVQYVGRFGNFREAGYDFSGILMLVNSILGIDYLHQNIRVKGGAYGAFASFSRNGNVSFLSYRDPKLDETNEVYEGIPEYLRTFEATEDEITEYIIGLIGNLDIPNTPNGETGRALDMYMNGLTYDMVQKSRDEFLNATVSDIREVAPLVEAVLAQNRYCSAGDEKRIEASTMFEKTIGLAED